MIFILHLPGGGKSLFIKVLYTGWQGYALWFIPVLFISLIIVRLIHFVKRGCFRIIICIFLLAFGVFLKYFKISLPWTLSVVPYACFLVMLGSYLKNFQSYIDFPKVSIMLAGLVISFTISCFWRLDMAWNNIIPVVQLTIGAIAGTAMMFSLSSFIVKYLHKISKMFQYIGRETFVIVAFSQLIIILFNAHFTCNSIIKYTILFVSLWLIICIKNRVKILLSRYGNIIYIKFGSR